MTTQTQFKTDIVTRYKNGESTYRIADDEGCSHVAVFRELRRTGVNTSGRFWVEKEIEKLKDLYPVHSNKVLLKEFPGRTRGSIKGAASNLGLKKRKRKKICKKCGEKFIVRHRQERELCIKCVKKQWEHDHPQKSEKRKKEWLQRNPGYRRSPEYRKWANRYYKQLREDPKFRLNNAVSAQIYQALKGNKKGRRWEELVGYTLEELVGRLEVQFGEKMNWDNYGDYWHIDHIKPKSLFEYTSSEDLEFKKCWMLENLQPLEKIANLEKSDTYLGRKV